MIMYYFPRKILLTLFKYIHLSFLFSSLLLASEETFLDQLRREYGDDLAKDVYEKVIQEELATHQKKGHLSTLSSKNNVHFDDLGRKMALISMSELGFEDFLLTLSENVRGQLSEPGPWFQVHLLLQSVGTLVEARGLMDTLKEGHIETLTAIYLDILEMPQYDQEIRQFKTSVFYSFSKFVLDVNSPVVTELILDSIREMEKMAEKAESEIEATPAIKEVIDNLKEVLILSMDKNDLQALLIDEIAVRGQTKLGTTELFVRSLKKLLSIERFFGKEYGECGLKEMALTGSFPWADLMKAYQEIKTSLSYTEPDNYVARRESLIVRKVVEHLKATMIKRANFERGRS